MPNKINVCLDIDETLTTDICEMNALQYPYLDKIKTICTNPDRYIYALREHFLHHGVVEFMMALIDIPNINLFFYSADNADRNIQFVQALLSKAKGKDYFSATKQQERIYSGPDVLNLRTLDFAKLDIKKMLLENSEIEKTKEINANGVVTYNLNPEDSLFKGVRKKNIQKITTSLKDLENTVIVDDMPENVLRGQEKNFISILPMLPEHLKNVYELENDKPDFIHSEDFKAVNHILYLAGLLIPAIEKVNNDSQGLTLTKVLSDIQLRQGHGGKLIPIYSALHQDLDYYNLGLNKLKKYNPNLAFILPSNLQEQLNLQYNSPDAVAISDSIRQNKMKPISSSAYLQNNIFSIPDNSSSSDSRNTKNTTSLVQAR